VEKFANSLFLHWGALVSFHQYLDVLLLLHVHMYVYERCWQKKSERGFITAAGGVRIDYT